MNYQLNLEGWGSILAFPAIAAEEISLIPDNALKVLLLLLSRPEMKSGEDIEKALNMKPEQVEEALTFWVKKGVLAKQTQKKASIKKPTADSITSEELAEMRTNNEKASSLFSGVEQLYGRPLNSLERRVILYILQYTLLPPDVILMIVDYCLREGKASPQYIQKISEDWAKQEINTHQKAEEKINNLLEQNEHERLVKNCFGIHNRKLSTKESGYISKWMQEYKLSIPLIQLAYERCVDSTGELSFPYINKVLSSWHKKGFVSPKDVNENETVKKGAKSKSAPSYNLEELAQKGLFLPEQEKQEQENVK